MGVLADAWVSAVGQLTGDAADATVAAAELEDAYRQPHRRYHVVEHIEFVLGEVSWLGAEVGLDPADSACVALAACAHDVVYTGRAGADERASADWAARRLSALGVAVEHVARVEALVLATAEHTAPAGDPGTAVLNDADLAILAAAPEAYTAYVEAVRFEYRELPDAAWRAGRSAVLRSLLDRPRLYATEPARDRWEALARRNVQAELTRLVTASNGQSPPGR